MYFDLYFILGSITLIVLSYLYNKFLIFINSRAWNFKIYRLNTLKAEDFSWHRFAKGNLAINTRSYEDYSNFMGKLSKYKTIFNNESVTIMPYEYWNIYGENFCISYDRTEKELRYNSKNYYSAKSYDIIKWDRRL